METDGHAGDGDPGQAAAFNQTHCLLIPEIAQHLLEFLPPSDLLNARLACKTWNQAANHSAKKILEAKFMGLDSLDCFNKTTSPFSRSLRKFEFNFNNSWRPFNEHAPVYKEFFEKFGGQIQSLTFTDRVHEKVVGHIFGGELQKCLTELKSLKICSGVIKSDVINAKFEYLGNLRHLTIEAQADGCNREYGQLEMLMKFLDPPCNIKSLTVHNKSDALTEALKKVVCHEGLENLTLTKSTLYPNSRNSNSFEYWAESASSGFGAHMKHLDISTGSSEGTGASPQVFYRFMKHVANSLQRLTLQEFNPSYLEAFPELNCLKYLDMTFKKSDDDEDRLRIYSLPSAEDRSDGRGDAVDLNFLTQIKQVEKLRLRNFRGFQIASFDSCHSENLRSLQLETDDAAKDSIKSLLEHGCFPNLAKLVIHSNRKWVDDGGAEGIGFRMEFSLRHAGFEEFLRNMPNIGLDNDINSSVNWQEIELLRKIKRYVVENCRFFREAHLAATSVMKILCFVSPISYTGAVAMTYRQLRAAGDTTKKEHRTKFYSIQELNILETTPVYYLYQPEY